jgi:hypothetical protein
MRQVRLVSIAFALLVAGSASAPAQQQVPLPMQPAPPGPYKSIAVTLPPRQTDASLDTFRKELGDIAKKKDRAALAGTAVTKGFFWQRGDNNDADAKKPGIDNSRRRSVDVPDDWAGRRSPIMPPMPPPRRCGYKGGGLQSSVAEL